MCSCMLSILAIRALSILIMVVLSSKSDNCTLPFLSGLMFTLSHQIMLFVVVFVFVFDMPYNCFLIAGHDVLGEKDYCK